MLDRQRRRGRKETALFCDSRIREESAPWWSRYVYCRPWRTLCQRPGIFLKDLQSLESQH